MPFQALPIALRKHTGSPVSKLLYIFLMNKCELDQNPIGGESAMIEWHAREAASFCQCTVEEVWSALNHLERLGLAYPDDSWVGKCSHNFREPERDRWEWLVLALPVTGTEPSERKRFKAADDQLEAMWQKDGYRCVACGASHDDVESWHVDHIIPRSLGGADVEENCQAICGRCNNRKGAKVHFVDFLGGRR